MKRKLSRADKEAIVAAVQAKTATMTQLAERYHVSQSLISKVFKNMTGSALRPRRGNENQEMSNEDQELALSEVVRVVVKLCMENAGYSYVIEINLKDQTVSIRQKT